MKIKEVLNEGGTGSLTSGVEHSLPNTTVLPNLKNNDFYMQYRMGVALASAHADKPFEAASAFGENMTVIGYTPEEKEILDLAMKLMGKPWSDGAKQIASNKSQESADVNIQSPMQPRGPVKKNETVQDN